MSRRKTLRSASSIVMLVGAAALAPATGEAAAEQRARSQTAAQAGNPAALGEGDQTDLLNQPITLDLVDAPLGSGLEAIARRAGLILAYNPDILPAGRTVTLRASALAARDALARVLNGTGLEPTITGHGQLTLGRAPAARTAAADAAAGAPQQAVVTGIVTDAGTGQPLSGAELRVDGSELSALTDAAGRYALEDVPAGTHTLVASMVGYSEAREAVTVTGTTASVNFALTASPLPLDEMVVTGTIAATQLRAVPSPVSVITADEIARRGVVRFQEIFQSIPGVGVAADHGREHLSFLYVRGANTLQPIGNSAIKTYIDGVEVANPVYALNQIDPTSIERVELIRGPQGSTLHGSGALAGVLQVFTKKGKAGTQAPSISATVTAGGLQSHYKDELTLVQNHRASITGGAQNISYSLGASFSDIGEWVEDELIDELGWNVRNGGSREIGLWGGMRYITGPLAAEVSVRSQNTLRYPPQNKALADPARSGRWDLPSYTKPAGTENELAFQTYGLTITYAAQPQWKHKLTIGHDGTLAEFRRSEPRLTTPADTFLLYQTLDWQRRSLSYSTALEASLNADLSATLQAGVDRSTWSQRTVRTDDATQLTGGLGNQTANIARGQLANHGFFGQLQVEWLNRLFLTLGLRADRNSGFGDEYGYAWSPRAGLAYTIDMAAATLKSRLSFGTAIRPPEPHQKLGRTVGNFVTLANGRLAAETQAGYDFGVELHAWPHFSASVSRYRQTAQDLIAPVSLTDPAAEPRIQQFQNVGRIKNAGWEIETTVRLQPIAVKAHYSITESSVQQLSPTYTGTDFAIGQRPLYVPVNTGGISVSYETARITLTLGLSHRGSWRGYRIVPYYEALFGTDPDRAPYAGSLRDYVDDYSSVQRYHVNARYRISKKVATLVTVDNLLNDSEPDQWDIGLVRGRQMRIGLRLDFGS